MRERIKHHLNDGGRGEIVREGIQVAILGPPNAGKSTFFNVLGEGVSVSRRVFENS
jgi:tRNA modification GTPase